MTYMAKVMERAADAPTAEMAQNIVKWALQTDFEGTANDLSDPLVAKMIESFQPSAESRYKAASAGALEQEYGLSAPGQPSRVGAIDGNTPTMDTADTPTGGNNRMVTKGMSFGPSGVTVDRVNLDAIRQQETAKGVPVDKAGMGALAVESVSGLEKAMNTLFPDGTPKSFDRGAAGMSNIFGHAAPFSEKAQDVRRWITSALGARLLMITGVASSPGEREQLYRSFMSSYGSNANSLFKALEELSNFYKSWSNITETRSLPNLNAPSSGQQEVKGTPKRQKMVNGYLVSY